MDFSDVGLAGIAGKSDDFTHYQITYFQFNLPPPARPTQDDRTKNHYSSSDEQRMMEDGTGMERREKTV